MSEARAGGRWMPPVHSPVGWRALCSGTAAWLGGGASARDAVERWIRGRWGPADHALTDSGTTALALAIRAAVARAPGPVALPAWGCYDIATATDQAGVPFVFYDLDPATLSPAPDSLRAALDAGAGVVVLAHYHGVPVDVRAIRRQVGPGVVLVEDAAQGSGTEVHGTPAGGVGDLGVLSFGRGKGITGGGGGALLVNDPGLDGPVRAELEHLAEGGRGSLWALGKLKAQWLLARPRLFALPASLPFLGLGETTYRPLTEGSRMPASCAGVLDQTLRLEAEEVRARRRNADQLLELLDGVQGVTLMTLPPGCAPGWLRFPVLAPPGAWREDRPTHRLGIMPGYPLPLPRLPGFGTRAIARTGATPGAERLSRELVTLPVHSHLRQADLDASAERLKQALGHPAG